MTIEELTQEEANSLVGEDRLVWLKKVSKEMILERSFTYDSDNGLRLLEKVRERRKSILPYDEWMKTNPDFDGSVTAVFGGTLECYLLMEKVLADLELALDIKNHH